MKLGKIYLIAAGFGDVELMTLKAVRLLGEADVVLPTAVRAHGIGSPVIVIIGDVIGITANSEMLRVQL